MCEMRLTAEEIKRQSGRDRQGLIYEGGLPTKFAILRLASQAFIGLGDIGFADLDFVNGIGDFDFQTKITVTGLGFGVEAHDGADPTVNFRLIQEGIAMVDFLDATGQRIVMGSGPVTDLSTLTAFQWADTVRIVMKQPVTLRIENVVTIRVTGWMLRFYTAATSADMNALGNIYVTYIG